MFLYDVKNGHIEATVPAFVHDESHLTYCIALQYFEIEQQMNECCFRFLKLTND